MALECTHHKKELGPTFSVAFLRRKRREIGYPPFEEQMIAGWPNVALSTTQRQALSALKESGRVPLAEELGVPWKHGRSYRCFGHVSDEQMHDICEALSKAGINLLNEIDAADHEVQRY
jgi:hypothetical protein